MSDAKQYIEVALPLPLRKTFTYEVPAELRAEDEAGQQPPAKGNQDPLSRGNLGPQLRGDFVGKGLAEG